MTDILVDTHGNGGLKRVSSLVSQRHSWCSARGHISSHLTGFSAAQAHPSCGTPSQKTFEMPHRPLLCPTAPPGHSVNSQLSLRKEGAESGGPKATEDPMAWSYFWVVFFIFPALIFPFPHSFWLWYCESELACFPDPLWVSDPETEEANVKIQILPKGSLGMNHGKGRAKDADGRGRGSWLCHFAATHAGSNNRK